MKTKQFEKIKPLSRYEAPKEKIIILKEKHKENELVYVGIKHDKNLNQDVAKYIRKQFRIFVKEHGAKNTVAVIEGPKLEDNTPSKNFIKIYRESGTIIALARKNKIRIESAEPDHRQLLGFVKKQNLEKERIGLWIFINYLTSIITDEKIILEKKQLIINLLLYLNQVLNITKQKKNPDIDVIYKTLTKNLQEKIKKTLLPSDFESMWKYKINKKELIKIQSPTSEQTDINKIGVMFNRTRDFFIAQKILKLWQKNNIFVVYGMNHLICQKDFLIKNGEE
jgi:hypothetical protein